jgi:sugar phosphate isomerase/epimerase
MKSSRRSFLQTGLSLGAAHLAGIRPGLFATAAPPATKPVFAVFSKHFGGLSHDRIADALAECGAEGVEAPIRAGGHVEPERAADELPKFAEALRKRGIDFTQMTSGLTEVTKESHAEPLLRTARALGVKRFRLGFFKYDLSKPIWPQVDEVKAKLKDLVALSREIGILPCFQNHSGASFVGAGIWDVAGIMREFPATDLAWSFDIMHATIEGNLSWPAEFALVKERIGVAYFKNFLWENRKVRPAPLAEGIVGKKYVDMLRESGFRGPVSLHVEYLKEKATNESELRVLIESTKRDLATLREWWS